MLPSGVGLPDRHLDGIIEFSTTWLLKPSWLYNKCWEPCFLAQLSLSCKFLIVFCMVDLLSKQHFSRLHGVTTCQMTSFFRSQWQSGRSDEGTMVLVRSCHSHFQRWWVYSGVIQVIFVWLVICSHSSSSIRIQVDDTLLGWSAELRIHVCGDAEHVFPSCIYLCRRVY